IIINNLMKNRKNNTIHFYCSWILHYILAKGVIIENELDFYLVQEADKALEFLKKLENKQKIDDEFISDFSQFCIYVSNMRNTVQMCINEVIDLNKEENEYTEVFKTEDLILLDRLLQVLYDNYRCLVEFDTFDKSKNFLLDSTFFDELGGSLRVGDA